MDDMIYNLNSIEFQRNLRIEDSKKINSDKINEQKRKHHLHSIAFSQTYKNIRFYIVNGIPDYDTCQVGFAIYRQNG